MTNKQSYKIVNMNNRVVIKLMSVIILLTSCAIGQSQNGKTSLPPVKFDEKIKEKSDASIIDVRTPEEFAKGHLVNAKNIDWNGNDFEKQISLLDKTKPVFVYCLSGGRSSSAVSKMLSLGFKEVYELDGGIMKWRGANLPETTGNVNKPEGMSKKQFEIIIDSEKTVLIDFYADWCAPCKKMKPYLDEISKEMSDNVIVVRINADDNQELCKELKIDALPVLQVYKNKTLTWKNSGYIEKTEVLKHL